MASYTIKQGDSWWKIAQEQMGSGAKYADLAKYNNMDLNKTIQPGMTINIPTSTAKTAASPTSAGNVNLAQSNGRPTYTQSDAVKNAQTALNDWNSKKPGEYQSKYQSQIDAILDDLINGKKPVYNPYEDPVYQNYRDQYMQAGKTAMQDTMANAAALSGGYGNSYANTAGNQAYQQYLSQLNNVIPELAQLAYERYQDEIAGKRNNLNTLQGLEQTEYGKYRDTVSDWNNERDYLAGRYDTEYSRDYGAYRDNVSDWESDRAFNYQKERDRIADEQWQKNFDEEKRQYEATMAYNKAQAARSNRSSSSKKTSSKPSVWGNMTDAQIKNAKALTDNIGEAIDYLQDTGATTQEEINARLREIGYTDAEISKYYDAIYKSSLKKGGGGSRPRFLLN